MQIVDAFRRKPEEANEQTGELLEIYDAIALMWLHYNHMLTVV